MPYSLPEDIALAPIELSDLLAVAAGNLEAFPTFYEPLESQQVPLETRVARHAARLQRIVLSPEVVATKAFRPSDGTVLGVAIWHHTKEGQTPFHLKRHLAGDSESDWEGVDPAKWEEAWAKWDQVRDEIMGGKEHYYLAPLWVIPEYRGKQIGSHLLQAMVDRVDAQSPSIPLYLEATKDGAKLYSKHFNFEVVGKSEYQEMVRWGKKEA